MRRCEPIMDFKREARPGCRFQFANLLITIWILSVTCGQCFVLAAVFYDRYDRI